MSNVKNLPNVCYKLIIIYTISAAETSLKVKNIQRSIVFIKTFII